MNPSFFVRVGGYQRQRKEGKRKEDIKCHNTRAAEGGPRPHRAAPRLSDAFTRNEFSEGGFFPRLGSPVRPELPITTRVGMRYGYSYIFPHRKKS